MNAKVHFLNLLVVASLLFVVFGLSINPPAMAAPVSAVSNSSPASSYLVSGTVKDARAGWPLYAKIDITGYSGGSIWTDPVTGFYSVTLPAGTTYTFNVNAWVAGYSPATVSVGPLSGNTTQNLGLTADPVTCNAPGYGIATGYFQNFEANNGGYTTSGTTSWAWGMPTSGPGSAHSGINVWATNLTGNYNNFENGYLTSPNIDLSAYAGQAVNVAWWQWLQTEPDFDEARVEVSRDGGALWTRVYTGSGSVDLAWTQHNVPLDSTYAVSNFRIRFRFLSDDYTTFPGWYVDDVKISFGCAPQVGGLVVGNTYDANTSAALAGATINNDSGGATTSMTTADPAVDDSFYTLFSPAGSHVFVAKKIGGYGSAVQTPTVVMSGTLRQNFNLPAGRLSYAPPTLQARVGLGLSKTVPFTLTNSGGIAAAYELIKDVPWLSELPVTGTVAAQAQQPVAITFDASVSQITQTGYYYGQLQIAHNTPYAAINIPVTMTVLLPVSLTVNVVGNGTVSQNPLPPYLEGDVVMLTANAATGWSFAGWSGDLGGVTNPAAITLNGNKSVTATFIPRIINLPGDYNGDGRTDIAVFRPSNGYWYVKDQFSTQWGAAGDIPVPGDYNKDGRTDLAVFRPTDGFWYVKDQFSTQWGAAGDIPVPGDYNADGRTDLAVFRPSEGNWYVMGQLGTHWGAAGDIPVPSDYNKDGRTDLAVFRPSDGFWYVKDQFSTQWGSAGDIPVPGDYNADGRIDLAVFRPSVGFWYVKDQFSTQWGVAGDIPVPGDYNGDHRTDLAVFRPPEGFWYVKDQLSVQWGMAGDIPVP